MDGLSRWLGERPHRTTTLNILMLTLLLAMVAHPVLFLLIGGLTVAMLAVSGIRSALLQHHSGWREKHPYELVHFWAPGAIAVLLAVFGLWLILETEAGSGIFLLGAFIFGFEAALLVLLGADMGSIFTGKPEAR